MRVQSYPFWELSATPNCRYDDGMAWIRKRQLGTTTSYLVCYRDGGGKQRSRSFERRRDADAYRRQIEQELEKGTHTPPSQSISVSEAADLWLDVCEHTGRNGREPVEASTLRQYRTHAELHIKPLIGAYNLADISGPRAIALRDELLRTRSRAMTGKIIRSASAIFSEAMSRGLVGRNPFSDVKVITSGRHKAVTVIPGRAEVAQMLEALHRLLKDPSGVPGRSWARWEPFFYTALQTGLRLSELRGLTWECVNLNDAWLDVRQRADEKGIIGPVKSRAGRRRVELGPQLVLRLKTWKLACPKPPKGKPRLVFPNGRGRVENHANIENRFWYPLQLVAKTTKPDPKKPERTIPRYRFHHLRHYYASVLIASGIGLKELQDRMGHESVQTTMDIYGHLFDERAEKMQSLARDVEATLDLS